MKGCRQSLAQSRVLPADQRFDAGRFAGHQAHLRLQDDTELAALDHVAKRHFRFQAKTMFFGKIVREKIMLAAAARFGTVHGKVGRAHETLN